MTLRQTYYLGNKIQGFLHHPFDSGVPAQESCCIRAKFIVCTDEKPPRLGSLEFLVPEFSQYYYFWGIDITIDYCSDEATFSRDVIFFTCTSFDFFLDAPHFSCVILLWCFFIRVHPAVGCDIPLPRFIPLLHSDKIFFSFSILPFPLFLLFFFSFSPFLFLILAAFDYLVPALCDPNNPVGSPSDQHRLMLYAFCILPGFPCPP